MIMMISKFYFKHKVLEGLMTSFGGKLGGFGGASTLWGVMGAP